MSDRGLTYDEVRDILREAVKGAISHDAADAILATVSILRRKSDAREEDHRIVQLLARLIRATATIRVEEEAAR